MVNFSDVDSLPFELENPFEYAIAIGLESLILLQFLRYEVCFLCFALAAFLLASSAKGFVTDGLQSINEMSKNKKSESDIIGPFSRAIRTHVEIKQLSSFH